MPEKRDRTFQTTLYVTLIIFASKAVGFAREMFLANYFGTNPEADAYNAAYSLLYLPILLLTSMITSTMVPLYIDARTQGGPKRANRFASNALNMFALFAVALSALMMIFSRPLIHLIYPGYDPARLGMAVGMARIMMPSMVFVVLSILLSSVLNATGHFMAAQLTGFALSFGMIASTVGFAPRYGIDALAWGVSAAGVLQVLILLPALRRDFRYSPVLKPKDPRFAKMLALGVPALLSMAVTEVSHIVDQTIGSGLNEGDVSSMAYAFRLITVITGVVGVPITTIMFSRMSEKAAAQDNRGIIDIVVQCVEVLLMVLLPIVALGCVLSKDIIRLLYMRGEFTERSMLVTSGVFFTFLLGVISFCVADFLNRAFHSMKQTKITMGVSLFVMTTNAVLSFIFSRLIGVNGLALGTVVSSYMGMATLFTLLRRRLGPLGLKTVAAELCKMLLAAGAALAASILLSRLMAGRNDTLQVILRLAAAGGAGLLAYLAALKLLRARQLGFLKLMLRRR